MELTTSDQLIGQSGLVTFGAAKGRLDLYAKYTQRDVVNNRYYIVARYDLVVTSGYIGSYGTNTKTLTGTGISGFTNVSAGSGNFTTQNLGSIEGWVSCDNNGNLTFTANGNIVFGSWGQSINVSGSATLPNIPRQSRFRTIEPFTIDNVNGVGQAFQVPVTKYVDSYYDVLTIRSYGLDFKVIENYKESDNVTFNSTDLAYLYSKWNDTNTAAFWFKVQTYTDSSKSTLIGTTSYQTTVNGTITPHYPDYALANITYYDNNSAISNITGDNTKIIAGQSDVKLVLSQNATVYKSADTTKTGFIIKVGNETVGSASGSDTFPKTISLGSINLKDITILVVDSRGNTTTLTKTITNFINYSIPTIASFTLSRTNQGIGEQVNASFNGTYTDWTGLAYSNEITLIQYRYKKKGSTEQWSSWNTINVPQSLNGNYSRTDYSLGNYDIDFEYEFEIKVSDKLQSKNDTETVNAGTPLLWLKAISKVIGIGQKPADGLPQGSIDVAGGIYRNGVNAIPTIVQNLDTPSDSNVPSVNAVLSKVNGTILYSNSNGNTGNLTLLDNVGNYRFIKIFYLLGTQYGIMNEFYINNNNNPVIQLSFTTNGNGIAYTCGTVYTISAKSMNINYAYRVGMVGGMTPGWASADNVAGITLIIGYK